MNNYVLLIILAVCAYFFGGINNAIMISKFKKKDIRELGSGNPGTLNMSRNFGIKLGLLTLLLDALKGVIPTLVTYFLTKDRFFEVSGELFRVSDIGIFTSGFCAVMGHIYPVFYKFKGGKGVASTIGVLIAVSAISGWAFIAVELMSLIGALLFIYFTEFGAAGSFIAITPPAISASIRIFVLYRTSVPLAPFSMIANLFILLICFFTWFAHRKNIERMLSGEEHPTSIKEMIVKAKAKKAEKKAKEQAEKNK